MNALNLWKLKITYPNGASVTRYKRGSSLTVGSAYQSDVVLPSVYPGILLEIDAGGRLIESHSTLRVDRKEFFDSYRFDLDFGTLSIDIENVSSDHQPLSFEVSRAATSEMSNDWTIWRYIGSVLYETESIKGCVDPAGGIFYALRSGMQVQWQHVDERLILKSSSGEIKSLKTKRSDGGFYIGKLDDEVFVVSRLAGHDTYEFLPKDFSLSADPFNKYLTAFLATWFLLIGFLNFTGMWLPEKTDSALLAQEELPELMKKVEIAKKESMRSKAGRGGNRVAGGGGVDTEARDERGGSGVAHDEVVVADLQSLSGGTKIFDALGDLDKRMSASGVQTASLVPSTSTANSILGALGVLGGGNKKGGGGLGVGGVGTKGFGGGGGGGSGAGFGKEGGDGLGLGSGQSRVSFDSGDSEIRGGLDRSEVDAVVRQNLAQVRFCYNRGLRSHPDLAGRVTSNFVIAADGKVKSATIRQSSLGVGAIDDCIRDKIAMWTFPKPRGGGEVTVNYPFLLRAN